MVFPILPIAVFVMTLSAADTKSDIAQVVEALKRASAASDGDAYVNLLTNDFRGITRGGIVRDREGSRTLIKGGKPPADLKSEEIATSFYSDTVIRISKETFTGTDGAKHETRVSQVFVKQNGAWKLAARSATDVAPQNQK